MYDLIYKEINFEGGESQSNTSNSIPVSSYINQSNTKSESSSLLHVFDYHLLFHSVQTPVFILLRSKMSVYYFRWNRYNKNILLYIMI